MIQAAELFDVFLSYGALEASVADQIERALQEAHITVFAPTKATAGAKNSDTIRQELARSDAVVVVLPSEGVMSANLGVEIGAAMAWQKPIFFIQTGNGRMQLPFDLKSWAVYPPTRIDDIIQKIKRGPIPLSQDDQEKLTQVYREMGMALDRILLDPSLQDDFISRFRKRSPSRVSGERLLHEAIRLRKRGILARLPSHKTAVE